MQQIPDLPSSEAVVRAAQWLADRTGDEFGVIIPTLKARFDLTFVQAAEACSLAKQFRMVRRAHG